MDGKPSLVPQRLDGVEARGLGRGIGPEEHPDHRSEDEPEKKRANIDSQRKPGSPDPRPAHVRNFLDCVKSRQQPVLNLEIGHHVSSVAHLGNIAYRTGRKLQWDGPNMKVTNCDEANELLQREYRAGWTL